jgi:hypothetical protein
MSTLEIRHQSIGKPEGEYHSPNEDAIGVSLDSKVLALSDGAGGSGVEAHQWSQYLIQHLPDQPILEFAALEKWQEEIWEPYFERINAELQTTNPDALAKLVKEGSSATLVAAWLQDDEVKLMAYGDSVCMHFAATQKLRDCNLKLRDFLHSPFLLNCNEPPLTDGFWAQTRQLEPGDHLLLASDAIGQFILGYCACLDQDTPLAEGFKEILDSPFRSSVLLTGMQKYLVDNPGASSLLDMLWDAVESPAKFRSFTNEKLEAGLLGLDDYSLIMVKIA